MNRLQSLEQKLVQGKNKEYIRKGKYSYQRLMPEHRGKALDLLAAGYLTNPVPMALHQKYPHLDYTFETSKKYWSYFIDQFVSNGLSIGVFNTEQNNELVGILVTSDSSYRFIDNNSELQKMSEDKSLVFYYQYPIIDQLEQLSHNNFPFLFDKSRKNLTAEIVLVVIDPKYRNARISENFLSVLEVLLKQANFSYVISQTTHVATKKVGMRNGYNGKCEVDAKKICVKINGKDQYPFSEIDQEHRYMNFLWKKL